MKLIPSLAQLAQGARGWVQEASLATAIFCISTFVISSFRASLNPDGDFELLDGKRISLILAGAAVFWFAIRRANRERPDLAGLVRMAKVAIPGIAVLFVLAAGWDVLIEMRHDNVAARNTRWILLWSGYFGTGVAAWLALQYGTALARVQPPDAPVLPQTAPEATYTGAHQGFWVKTGRRTFRIAYDDVEWIEAEGNYVRIHAGDGTHGLVRASLAATCGALESADFVRIHRSALCRRSAIRGYRRKPSGAMLALLQSGSEAPIGRSYAGAVLGQVRRGAPAVGADVTVSAQDPKVLVG